MHRDGIAASNRKLGVEFDAIYTAEDIGAYKPADANFEYLLAHLKSDLGMDRSDILHTAQSLHHDHEPANRFGLANAWIDRRKLERDEAARDDALHRFRVLFAGRHGRSRRSGLCLMIPADMAACA